MKTTKTPQTVLQRIAEELASMVRHKAQRQLGQRNGTRKKENEKFRKLA